MEVKNEELNIKEVKKFSPIKLIDFLISLAIAIGGLIMFILGFKDDGSRVGLIFGGIFVLALGIALVVNSFLVRDRHFIVNNHKVRCFVGFMFIKVTIDDQTCKKSVILNMSTRDVDLKVDNLLVQVHQNGWGASAIFFNGKKYIK